MSDEFTMFLQEQGITNETSAPHKPQQNHVAERMNQSLLRGVPWMMEHAEMTKGFWAEAIGVTAQVLNHSPRKGLEWRTAYEPLYGRLPEVSYLHVFDSRAWLYSEKPGMNSDA